MTIIVEDRQPTPAERFALRVVQLGAIAVVVASAALHAFELDRFFVPKELALHLTALLAGLFALRVRLTRVDLLLGAYLALSIVSAVFATNPWLALRAVAITASGIVLFWVGRTLRDAGLSRPLLGALAFAVVLAAITSLLQTYGIETTLFSESRAPGGTLGNRNFVAHAAAFGVPLLFLAALQARSGGAWLLASSGVAITVGTLVLTRSRAAWLAFGAVVAVFAIATIASAPLRRDGRSWRRLLGIVVFAAAGVAAAILIPNTLRWRSQNPYLESLERVADYHEGSGAGRLVQYDRSLRMAVRHPIVGVGPGNWPVEYPEHARRNDPSISDDDGGMTFNPWPSSDWIAWMSERGFAAVALIALVFLGIALSGIRQLFAARDAGESAVAAALLGTVAGAVVTGLFDAVLLLALPAFLVWTALGALWTPPPSERAPKRLVPLLVVLLSAIGAARSAAQLTAMTIYVQRGDRVSLAQAARIDPGNYRLRLRLARISGRKQRCAHALAARSLFPHADAARAVSRGCE
ncbi:MAG TPA: O-antigen ligase family protein [Thermoanaerobaculia bacterium]|nr:O-antigen ligase family protein [Thermoanaerobaculia bacterium]